jgi:hypothetical protein
MNIDDLSQAKTLTDQHEIVVFDQANRATRKATVEQLAFAVRQVIEGEPDDTAYALNASTVTALPAAPGADIWAQITLPATAPTLTVILPGIDDRAHGQEVLVTVTQTVTALTINANGAALSGAPTTASPTAPFRLKYDLISNTWYRIS